eukprot:scaffold73529_cov82-Phaeocystis_antarctica.AAC.2
MATRPRCPSLVRLFQLYTPSGCRATSFVNPPAPKTCAARWRRSTRSAAAAASPSLNVGVAPVTAPRAATSMAEPRVVKATPLPASVKPGVVTGQALSDLLEHAKENKYAIPAVNVVSSCSIASCLEAAKSRLAHLRAHVLGRPQQGEHSPVNPAQPYRPPHARAHRPHA